MRKAYAFSLAILFIVIFAPYLFAALRAAPDHRFTGLIFNVYDGNSYLAKMLQGYRGEWRFTLPYTDAPGEGAYLFMFYLFLGHLARWVSLSPLIIYHVARLAGACLLAWMLFRLVRNSFREPFLVMWVFILALFGSGSGWLLSLWGIQTSDFWVAEAFPFLSAFATPHFSIGLALLIWIFLETIHPHPGRQAWVVGLLSFLLAMIAPFGIVVAIVVLGGLAAFELITTLRLHYQTHVRENGLKYPLWDWPASITSLTAVLLGGLPVIAYQYWAIQSDPVLSAWNSQNLTPSPPPLDIIISTTPALILAVFGWEHARKNKTASNWLFLIWFSVGLLLLYLPFGLQRRFMMGFFIPVACLAGLGVNWLARKPGRKVEGWARLVLVFSLLTNFVILLSIFAGISAKNAMIFLDQDEALALDWIDEHTEGDALVLASPEMGLFIPARTGRRVIYGHPFETINAEENKQVVIDFYADASDLDREAFLKDRGIGYIFYGPRERSLGSPSLLDSFPLVFSTEKVQLYQVVEVLN